MTSLFESMSLDQYHSAGFRGETIDFVEAKDQKWAIGSFYASKGACYNYAVMFFNLGNPSESFCTPSVEGVIAEATISPDLAHLAYLTVGSPTGRWIMIADVIPKYKSRLDP